MSWPASQQDQNSGDEQLRTRNQLPPDPRLITTRKSTSRKLQGRTLMTFNHHGPLAFVMDIGTGPTKASEAAPLADPTIWLFVVSEGVSQPNIESAFRSATTIAIKKPLHNRLRDVLSEIASDVTGQFRPASRLSLPDLRPALESLRQPLTPRQIQIARMVSEGFSNKKIAESLGLSVGTVKVHLHRVFEALKVSNRVELAVRAGALREAASPSSPDRSTNVTVRLNDRPRR